MRRLLEVALRREPEAEPHRLVPARRRSSPQNSAKSSRDAPSIADQNVRISSDNFPLVTRPVTEAGRRKSAEKDGGRSLLELVQRWFACRQIAVPAAAQEARHERIQTQYILAERIGLWVPVRCTLRPQIV